MGRITIASQYGSESVVTNQSGAKVDQVVVPQIDDAPAETVTCEIECEADGDLEAEETTQFVIRAAQLPHSHMSHGYRTA